jgi:hypothetical protein
MKILSALALLGALFTFQAFACGGVYKGKLEDAQRLQNKQLNCAYNGEKSVGTLSLSIPRCLNARPVVLLEAFDESLDVINLNVELIRGIVKYTYKIKVETAQADGKIVCTADVYPKN